MSGGKLFDEFFERTLDDGKLSRAETKVLDELVAEAGLDDNGVARLRSRALTAARARMGNPGDEDVLRWFHDVIKRMDKARVRAAAAGHEVFFLPDPKALQRVVQLINGTRAHLDICVFTITDNRIYRAIIKAHERRVKVRIITDDDKSADTGSDVLRLARAGVPVRMDHDPAHMHHKFAVFDGRRALTGSYNWTRSAASQNRENILITDAPQVIDAYRTEFEKLWEQFG